MSARRACAALLALACTGASVTMPAPWQPATIAMHAIRVGPHSYYVQGALEEATRANQGFIANAGFVVTGDGVVVFDALGSPALGDRLIETIRRITDQPIRRVILSHYHADHFYGMAAFQRIGAEVYAHEAARRYLESPVAAERLAQRRALLGPWLGPDFRLRPPDRWLGEHTTFELGGVQFDVVHVGPAHSPEDVSMRVAPDGVLFAGDVATAGRIPFIGDADTASWLRALEQLRSDPARILVPGHGAATRRAADDLDLTRDYLRYLRDEMGRAVDGFQDFDEAYAHIDWSRFAGVPAFAAANRANAYNVFLQLEQESLRN